MHNIGKSLNEQCNAVIASHGLQHAVQMAPSDWMPMFVFKDNSNEVSAGLRTLVMQEMIKRGVLFQGILVPCFSHTLQDIEYFAQGFSESLEVYKKALDQGYQHFLVGEPAKPVFRKYL